MKSLTIGVLLGICAGIIDIIPMIIQKLSWDANISAFTMWAVVGFIISASNLRMNPVIKGILIAFLVLLPTAVLIGWESPSALIPVAVMTSILGGLMGFSIHKFTPTR